MQGVGDRINYPKLCAPIPLILLMLTYICYLHYSYTAFKLQHSRDHNSLIYNQRFSPAEDANAPLI